MYVTIRGEAFQRSAYIIAILAVLIVIASGLNGGLSEMILVAPFALLFVFVGWMGWWNPRIEVSAGGVRIVNIVREHFVPWTDFYEAENKWGLYIHTRSGKKFSVWSVPSRAGLARERAKRKSLDESRAVEFEFDGEASTTIVAELGRIAEELNDRAHNIRSNAYLRRELAAREDSPEFPEATTTRYLPISVLGFVLLFAATATLFTKFS
ncbi:MAG: PH domain-containing protein [Actinomycetaceae bacterium]|nr:PH domain-containing protein [Actinomycetaceae bacterium]